jgi:hypothetical protein
MIVVVTLIVAAGATRLKFVWGTKDAWLAVIRGFWSVCVVDAYNAQRAFQPYRHRIFRGALKELIDGLLTRGAASRAGGRASPRLINNAL